MCYNCYHSSHEFHLWQGTISEVLECRFWEVLGNRGPWSELNILFPTYSSNTSDGSFIASPHVIQSSIGLVSGFLSVPWRTLRHSISFLAKAPHCLVFSVIVMEVCSVTSRWVVWIVVLWDNDIVVKVILGNLFVFEWAFTNSLFW